MRFHRAGPLVPPIATGALLLLLVLRPPIAGLTRDSLPAALSDREFWELSETLSEPDGFFRSNSGSPDNLLSNESQISTVAGPLGQRVKPSGVYLGVGPEQNFTYIAAMRPRIAFITDIRRGNLHLHLVYKGLFEMSANRIEFVARLFSRSPAASLTARSSAAELMSAYLRAEAADEAGFKANLKAIFDHLTRTRGLPLSADDRAGIEYVYRNFHRFGPGINYTSSINGRSGSSASYAAIMSTVDYSTGEERTYLANETLFASIKTLQTRNLIVPVVGDFAGPKALRAIGAFLKDRGAVVTAFYVSNVEQYLQRNGVWSAFCANVATMPLDAASVFIRPGSGRSGSFSGMAAETTPCAAR
ncbi:MAG TPA: hypothetical protein VES67_02695 [Vicinamibacterales bacterium]|nr:hypothetical protein [Vicinamibacterales bacterium]